MVHAWTTQQGRKKDLMYVLLHNQAREIKKRMKSS